MKSIIYITFLVSIISFNSSAQTPINKTVVEQLQKKIDSCVTAYKLPGISTTILLSGNRYWNGVAGKSDIYTNQPMDSSLIFFQASVTKLFVATLVMQLIEQQQLSLDDTIGKFLQPLQTIPSSITIRNLLSHKSGLFNFIGGNPATSSTWVSNPDSIWSPRLAIETYNKNPVAGQGQSFSYANTNYILLGMIIESITGKTFAEVLRNRILTPYNLNQTFFPHIDSIKGPVTKGWTSFSSANVYDTDASIIINKCSSSIIYTSGALVARPADVAKFTKLLFSGKILHDTTLNTMKTFTAVNFGDNTNGYGYGVARFRLAGKTFYGHGGDFSGFTTFTAHNPTDSITLTISINRNNAPRGTIATEILKELSKALNVEFVQNSDDIFSIYPNPSTGGLFTISHNRNKLSKHNITVYTPLGRKVYSNNVQSRKNSKHEINLSAYPAGVYYITISYESHNDTKRIVIQ